MMLVRVLSSLLLRPAIAGLIGAFVLGPCAVRAAQPTNAMSIAAVVNEDIIKILEPYDLVDFAFDRGFQGGQMGTNLMKTYGDKVIAFPQGILSMNAPFREFVELLPAKRLHHDGHPVMRWMVSNVVAERRSGMMKPSKDKSTEKIDGVTAACMAIGRALFAVANQPRSVYDSRGITVI
jgi:phage terminase large subunit-like protein